MAYQSPYQAFIFEDYSFDPETNIANFHYSFDGQRHFNERIVIPAQQIQSSNPEALEKTLQLAFYTASTSYYKAFPTKKVIFKSATRFLASSVPPKIYTEGLSQFCLKMIYSFLT